MSQLPAIETPLRTINVPARGEPRRALSVRPVTTTYLVEESVEVTLEHGHPLWVEGRHVGNSQPIARCESCRMGGCRHALAAMAEFRGVPA